MPTSLPVSGFAKQDNQVVSALATLVVLKIILNSLPLPFDLLAPTKVLASLNNK